VGLTKTKVYFNRPNNLEDLRQKIRAQIEQINPDIIERSVQSECQMGGGGQFQHLHSILLLTFNVCLFLFEVN
jgi:hypothetical protein